MTMYGADLARVHHLGFGDLARGAAGFLLREVARVRGRAALVVDLGCGSGEWLARLAAAGHRAIGVDPSAAMLRLARRVAPGARLVRASAYDHPLTACDAVTALGEALNYVEPGRPPPLAALFRRVGAALPPGGLFAFDVLVRGRPMRYRTWREGDGWATLIEVTERGRLLTRDIVTFVRRGRAFRRGAERHLVWVHDRAAVERALRRAGFTVRVARRYGDQPLAPRRLAFIARERRPAPRRRV